MFTRFAVLQKSPLFGGYAFPVSSAPRRKRNSAHLEHELKIVASCPVMAALTLLRGRWKPSVIWNLREGRKSLAEMRRFFPMASEKMLAQHVGELVRDGQGVTGRALASLARATDAGL